MGMEGVSGKRWEIDWSRFKGDKSELREGDECTVKLGKGKRFYIYEVHL